MIAYIVLFAVAFLALRIYLGTSRKYFPGPPSKLFFGNAHEMQRFSVWEYLASLTPIYGVLLTVPNNRFSLIFDAESERAGNELYFYNPLLGTSILVLNSFEAAQVLLVQRAAIYSDRPPSTMLELYFPHAYTMCMGLGLLTIHQQNGRQQSRSRPIRTEMALGAKIIP